MLQAFAAIVTRQAAIPIAVTGLAAAAAQTRPTAAIPNSSFVAGRTLGDGVFPAGPTGPDAYGNFSISRFIRFKKFIKVL